jgi:L-lysine exporter family protein LysE/ArgO
MLARYVLFVMRHAALITLGILGVGSILQTSPFFLNFLAILGAIFLYWYACNSFIRAYKGNSHLHIEQGVGKQQSLAKLMLTTLAITLFNPHVYLDTLVIIGGIYGTLGREEKYWFLLGSIVASFVWFLDWDMLLKNSFRFLKRVKHG